MKLEDQGSDSSASDVAIRFERERSARLRALFSAARRLAAAERPAYLQEACDDGPLRAEVEELLGCLERAPAQFGTGGIRSAVTGEHALPGPEPPPPAVVGPYRIEGELGRGGMAIVYLAHDERLGRKVALRSVPAAVVQDPLARARLEREARAVALLNHPNVATVHGLEEVEGRLFLVLERVEERASTADSREDGCRSRKRCGWGREWRRRSSKRTSGAFCTATSSPATSCAARAAR